MVLKNFTAAIDLFSEAVSDDANDVNAFYRRGQSFFCLGKYKEAIADFDHSIDKGAYDANLFLWKGTAYAKLGDLKLAILNYERAMRINPKLVETRQQSAPSTTSATAVEESQSPKGLTESSESRPRGSASVSPELSSGQLLLENKAAALQDAAKKFALQGAAVIEDSARQSSEKSAGKLSLGASEHALNAYKTAAQNIIENSTGYFYPGATYSGIMNRKGKELVLSAAPIAADWSVSTSATQVKRELKSPRRIVKETAIQIAENPQDARLYFQRGRAALQLGQMEQALTDLNRAAELDKTNPHYFLALAFFYHKQNNAAKAESEIFRAQEADPAVPPDLSFIDTAAASQKVLK